jgi:hypothetical protein
MVNRYPVYFWISVTLAVTYFWMCLDASATPTEALLAIVLLVAVLYVTNPLVEPHGRHHVSYFTTGISDRLVEPSANSEYEIPSYMPYRSYRAFPILVVIMKTVSSLNLEYLVKYFPPLLLIPISILVFIFYNRLIERRLALLGSFLFIVLSKYSFPMAPILLGYILMPTFLVLLTIKQDRTVSVPTSILLVIVMVTITVTHILPSFALIPLLSFQLVLNLINKDSKRAKGEWVLATLSLSMFIAWLIYVAVSFFESQIPILLASFESFDRLIESLTLGEAGLKMSYPRMLVALSNLVPLVIIVILAITGIIYAVITKQYGNYIVPIVSFIAFNLLIIIPYGGDINILRTAFFITLVAPLLSLLFPKKFSKRIILAYMLLGFMFALINPIAISGNLTSFVVPSSEMAGVQFFVTKTDRGVSYFSQLSEGIIYYHDPARAYVDRVFSLWSPPLLEFNINREFEYLLYGTRDHNSLIWYLGYDPISEKWDEIDKNFNHAYDNGNFWILCRR